MITILGVDPGSRITGYGFIQVHGQQLQHVHSGSIRTPEGDFSERLHVIFTELTGLIQQFLPHEFAIEQVFMHRNPNSAIKLGQARGAALVAAAQHQLPVSEYAPRQIKQAVVGYGGAEKNQVQHMIRLLLKLNATPQADAADALAIAICHANLRQSRQALARALQKQGVSA